MDVPLESLKLGAVPVAQAGDPMARFHFYTYSLGDGVKGIAPPNQPEEREVFLAVLSSRKRPEDGRTEWTYGSSDPDFPPPAPGANQKTAIDEFTKSAEARGWKLGHGGVSIFR